ncbi:Fructose-1,6-bisphosphatase class 1 [uncultured archaeon]|nr:Fructose-1,6-bisphosphatase class 1 [uncultured archaeon]
MDFAEHLRREGVERDMARIMLLIAKKSRLVQKAFFTHSGICNTRNIHGEQQMELDTYADDIFMKAMEKSRLVRTVASEEQDDIVEIVKAKGSYGVTLDPLDGSSLIKTNLAVGTIAGFFNEGDVLEKGARMDGAMCILYGPITSLVYTAKKGVHEFVLSPGGKFVLKRESIQLPEGKIYCPGGLRNEWPEGHAKFISYLESQSYKLRFSGGFVPDFQQVLTYGGIFTYPAAKSLPQGKLRLIFEANPMALLAEQAGGQGTNGLINLHDLKPESLSQRTPVYVGGKKEIEMARKHLSENK